ncbi:Hpt domain-containing protein [Rhizobium sp. SAFR-030]|uniref:Hpt domain-containing protein n=1 Tax=Rhizobium sp. SAFR-030 TaxID=3387277 RepID=UPI003F808AB6
MAAVSIAFEAPEQASGSRAGSERPIDLVHLAVQTMGDKLLEAEVLQLFTRQARAALAELSSGSPKAVVASAHRLKSAANGVGAFKVAAHAQSLENDPQDAVARAALSAAVVETENFILRLSR